MKLKKSNIISIVVVIVVILIAFFAFRSSSTIKNELGLGQRAGIKYNDLSISEADLDQDLKDLANNKPLIELLKKQNQPLVEDGKVTPTYRASWANIKMRTLAIKEIRIKHKMEVTDADIKKAKDEAKNLFASDDEEQTKKIWDAFPKEFQNRLAESFAEQYALLRAAPKVTDKDIKEFFDKNQATLNAPCESGKTISHILVATEKEAQDIKKQLDNGADFSKLAKEKSTDKGSGAAGGSLGCFVPGNFVEEFEKEANNLQIGQTSGIVKTQYGYHILKAQAYTAPKLEDVKEQIRTQLEPEKQQVLFTEVQDSLKKAKIFVLPKYGKVSFAIDPSTGKKSELPSIVPIGDDKKTTTTTGAIPTT